MRQTEGARHHASAPGDRATAHRGTSHYRRLLLMSALSFIAMYVLMYAMVNALANVHHNLNQLYMAGLMTAAMVLIELLVMSAMYQNRRLNVMIAAAGLVALTACWLFIRRQNAIGDRQFLNSMIPHHAAAILMCRQASVRDPEIRGICRNIVASQEAEIDQMKSILRRSR